MRLGEIIQQYRARNKLSMGDFAKMANLSKPYISMLEANRNSNGGKPIAPSVETLQKVSSAIGISLDDLLRMLGDEEIDVRKSSSTDEEKALLNFYRDLNKEGQNLIMNMLGSLRVTHAKQNQLTAGVVQSNQNGNNYYGISGGNFKSTLTIE